MECMYSAGKLGECVQRALTVALEPLSLERMFAWSQSYGEINLTLCSAVNTEFSDLTPSTHLLFFFAGREKQIDREPIRGNFLRSKNILSSPKKPWHLTWHTVLLYNLQCTQYTVCVLSCDCNCVWTMIKVHLEVTCIMSHQRNGESKR